MIAIDNPPVNALSYAVRRAVLDLVEQTDGDSSVEAVVLLCAGKTFAAGADIREFDAPAQPPAIYEIAARLEAMRKPAIAAIHGHALGGGLELALGCHYRLATADARFGFPEVTLGMIPGSGGVVRSMRCLATEVAVELLTSGRRCDASEAQRIGLIDFVTTSDIRSEALNFAQAAARRALPQPVSQRVVQPQANSAFWSDQLSATRKRARGAEAPVAVVEIARISTELPFDAARQAERAAFERLRDGDQSRALRHVFAAEAAAARSGGSADSQSRIRAVGVIGGGTMGCGIALAFLQKGLPVVLVENSIAALDAARNRVVVGLTTAYERRLISAPAYEKARENFTSAGDFDAVGNADLVVEAVFEDLAVKSEVFSRLERVVSDDAILATNTSYLDPEKIAGTLSRPERFVGLHFFSPAQIMRLVEIIPVAATSSQVVAAAFAVAKTLGKIGVRAGICDGFIGNRLLTRYRASAEELLRKGCSIGQVDATARAFGYPMGPFEAQDLAGLDIAFKRNEALRAQGRSLPETLSEVLCRAGRLGRKSAAGWYDYDPSGEIRPSSAAVELLRHYCQVGTAQLREEDIAERLLRPMIEEGHGLLAEGIAGTAEDIDLVQIHGYGFPRWRGGLMYWSRQPADRV